MKKLILPALLIMSISGNAQFGGESAKQTYSIPGLKDSIAKHKTVAILPLKTTISYKKLPKDFDAEANKAEESKASVNLQQGMYTYLLRKSDNFSVTFQDVERTNALLKQAGVFQKLDEVLPDSLCKILGVDAVIKSSYAYEKTSSEGAAIVKTVVFGGIGSKTGNGALTMQVYNHNNGALLWRFYKEMNETLTSNANEVMERMMKKVARNFPYEK
jgi:hypothetical protein